MSVTPSDEEPSRPERLRVCSFESRRAEEMRGLIERQGAVATVAPSMQEVPRAQNREVLEFAERVVAGRVDVVIFMTGSGAQGLREIIEPHDAAGEFPSRLGRCTIIARGPKPAAVLRDWGVRIDHRVPEPNTWRELLAVIDAAVPVAGKRVAVQEYGEPNEELYRELEQRGGMVLPVPVYRWALPDDLGPLRSAIDRTIAGGFDVLLFTAAQQALHVLSVAQSAGRRDPWLAAARRCVVASIGPTCSERLAELGLPPDCQPSHPRMGQLVAESLRDAPRLLAARKK